MVEFSEEDLVNIYRIVKEYLDDLPEDMDDWYHGHSDFDEEPVDRREVEMLLGKIGTGLSGEVRVELDKDFLRKKYHPYNNDVDEDVYEIIGDGLGSLKSIEIEYFSMEKGEFVRRVVDVYYKSKRYVIGFCHLRKAIRKFKTSRIGSAKLTGNEYEIPLDFKKDNY